jgi:hypothetical protein
MFLQIEQKLQLIYEDLRIQAYMLSRCVYSRNIVPCEVRTKIEMKIEDINTTTKREVYLAANETPITINCYVSEIRTEFIAFCVKRGKAHFKYSHTGTFLKTDTP